MMEKDAKIFVAGHRGMVGSAIVRELERQGYMNIITRTHKELDLTRQDQVERFFAEEKPEYVFLAAAKVGGRKTIEGILDCQIITFFNPCMFHRNVYLCCKYHIGFMPNAKSDLAAYEQLSMQEMWYSD